MLFRSELMVDAGGIPLKSHSGRQLYQLTKDLLYYSDVAHAVNVPEGFVTDLASVPNSMLAVFGEIAQMPAVIHDYLYSTRSASRAQADAVLMEAMEVTGEPWWKRKLFWAAVRVGGASHYDS